ncbi:MAG: Holliday junction resolvase-like protein [Chloroflexota bacterium]|nr:Holliday junction resolvase-like protein [Chloroflexota bacterium]
MFEQVLTILLVIALAGLIYFVIKYAEAKQRVEGRARDLFERWRAKERESEAEERAEILFQTWREREEERIREDAIKRSQAVIRGKVTEHLVPFFPDFVYNPRDARFIGTPVDLIIFDGLSDGDVKQVVFVEVKSGKSAALSTRERRVRDCIRKGAVTYEILQREER